MIRCRAYKPSRPRDPSRQGDESTSAASPRRPLRVRAQVEPCPSSWMISATSTVRSSGVSRRNRKPPRTTVRERSPSSLGRGIETSGPLTEWGLPTHPRFCGERSIAGGTYPLRAALVSGTRSLAPLRQELHCGGLPVGVREARAAHPSIREPHAPPGASGGCHSNRACPTFAAKAGACSPTRCSKSPRSCQPAARAISIRFAERECSPRPASDIGRSTRHKDGTAQPAARAVGAYGHKHGCVVVVPASKALSSGSTRARWRAVVRRTLPHCVEHPISRRNRCGQPFSVALAFVGAPA
jgi:hypothetical protein